MFGGPQNSGGVPVSPGRLAAKEPGYPLAGALLVSFRSMALDVRQECR